MPQNVQGALQGTAAAFQDSLCNKHVLVLTAPVTVYLVLGVLYESYIHPTTILSTPPSAGVGVLLALYITGNDFSVIALIGIVLLSPASRYVKPSPFASPARKIEGERRRWFPVSAPRWQLPRRSIRQRR